MFFLIASASRDVFSTESWPTKRENKNAFQWDAYRPLVDRIPAHTVRGVNLHRGYLPGGVPAWGTPPPREQND